MCGFRRPVARTTSRLDLDKRPNRLGHSRHFDRAPVTSGLPRSADVPGVRPHVSKVPQQETRAPRAKRHSITSSAADGLSDHSAWERFQRTRLCNCASQFEHPNLKAS
jgi:hypothetical protein